MTNCQLLIQDCQHDTSSTHLLPWLNSQIWTLNKWTMLNTYFSDSSITSPKEVQGTGSKWNKWKHVSVCLNSQQPTQSHITLWNVKTFLYNDITLIFSNLKFRSCTGVKRWIYSIKDDSYFVSAAKTPCMFKLRGICKTPAIHPAKHGCVWASHRFFF